MARRDFVRGTGGDMDYLVIGALGDVRLSIKTLSWAHEMGG